jgi:hypothetical protein
MDNISKITNECETLHGTLEEEHEAKALKADIAEQTNIKPLLRKLIRQHNSFMKIKSEVFSKSLGYYIENPKKQKSALIYQATLDSIFNILGLENGKGYGYDEDNKICALLSSNGISESDIQDIGYLFGNGFWC